MEIRVTIIKDNGEQIEISRKISDLDGANIIRSVEKEVQKVQDEIGPLLSESIIEEHQNGFEGEKNKEEERNK